MDFGQALGALKSGRRVAREGWNGRGMWLVLVRSFTALDVATPPPPTGADPYWAMHLVGPRPEDFAVKRLAPWIGMKTADGCFVPWLASQTDLLAEDWVVLEGTS